jgi:hypothetical protein
MYPFSAPVPAIRCMAVQAGMCYEASWRFLPVAHACHQHRMPALPAMPLLSGADNQPKKDLFLSEGQLYPVTREGVFDHTLVRIV